MIRTIAFINSVLIVLLATRPFVGRQRLQQRLLILV